MKKLLTRLTLLMILCAALALPVFADAVTDSISVCIGYFGWSEDEYVEKAKFSWQELDDWYGGALDTHEEYYSYCNGSGRTYLAFARGFYIRDLLDYAGVDVNSIASIDFFTKDHSVGAYRSFTKYALLDQPRYYFPNLAGDAETGELYAWDGGDDLWVGAYQVEPMLALEDYTEWDTAGFDFESYADESLFSTGSAAGEGTAPGGEAGTGQLDLPQPDETEAAPVTEPVDARSVYVLAGSAVSTGENGTTAGEGMQNGSVQLLLPDRQEAKTGPVWAALALSVLLGFGYGLIRYKKLR